MTVAFYTLGCKLNQCETEALASAARSKGFSIMDSESEADLYIVNTCAVTSKSEQKARRMIRSFAGRNPESLVIVTGCYAQVAADPVSSLARNVLVVPQTEKSRLFELICASLPPGEGASDIDLVRRAFLARTVSGAGHPEDTNPDKNSEGEDSPSLQPKNPQNSGFFGLRSPLYGGSAPVTPPGISKSSIDPGGAFASFTDDYNFHSRPFLKIQDGCDCTCAYCIVPIARGKATSLDPDRVCESVSSLEAKGYGEIVLTGVNISAYDYRGFGLAALLGRVLGTVKRARIRLSSIEPESIDESLGEILSHDSICPHFHIPVQSGSDRVLGRMRRRYDSAKLMKAADIVRTAKPGCFLGCDIIVGFPGETDEDFADTKRLVLDAGFSALHVFQFSARPGTAAYSMQGKVRESVKKARATELSSLSAGLVSSYIDSNKGSEQEAVLQQQKAVDSAGTQSWLGLTGNYLKVHVHGIPHTEARRSALVKIRIDKPGLVSESSYIVPE